MPVQVNVFLDTNIFMNMKYDFSKSPLSRLKKYVSLGIVRLFTNEIVVREVEANIRIDTATESAHLKNAVKKHCFREVLESDGYELLSRDFRQEKWDELIISKFHKYLEDTDCTILKNDNIKLNEIFEYYFQMIPPFESREEKKHEFPDAVVIKSIKNYLSEYNTEMIVVAKDTGWEKAFVDDANIELIDDLKKALIQISSKYGGTEESKYLEFLGTESSGIIDHINDWLYNLDWDECFESDDSLDIEGIESVEVENIKLIFDGFEYIDKEEACARFKAIVSVCIEYEYNNYDYALYDKEDDAYYNVKHGTANEKHVCPIEFSINILNDGEDMDINDYEFEGVELSSDTEVSSEFREDSEEPEPDDEYFAEKTYTTCLDCGKPIGIDNDGLNGFCENCGKNH